MTPQGEEFPFVVREAIRGAASLSPVLPFTLVASTSVAVEGLLDTGAAVSVLPYSVGQQLGAIWEEQHPVDQLGGNLARCEAKGLLLSARVAAFPAVQLVFAWANTDDAPLLLGQMNFFREFDVCCFASRAVFQIRPKQTATS